MRFMLIFLLPESTWLGKELVARVVDWKDRLMAEGVYQTGSPLKPAGYTTTLIGKPVAAPEVQQGPFDDGERGFYAFEIITCESRERALEIAKTHPGLDLPDAVMEVREIWDEHDPILIGDDMPFQLSAIKG